MIKIKYLGHSSFKIKGRTATGEDITLITDPFDKKDVGLPYSKQQADIVTVSHDHTDHNQLQNVEQIGDQNYFLVDAPGEYEVRGLRIFGVKSYHDTKQGAERGKNTIYVYDFQDARVAHLGDLGDTLDSNQLELLEDIDILMIPVGGKFTIDPKTAMQIIDAIEPLIVIPMHYKTPGHNEHYAELGTLEDFLKEAGVDVKPESDLTIKSSSDFPQDLKILPLES